MRPDANGHQAENHCGGVALRHGGEQVLTGCGHTGATLVRAHQRTRQGKACEREGLPMMKGEKGDRPSVGAPGRSEGSGACEASSDPITQFTTPAPAGARVHIADFLSPGQQNAVPLRHLKDLLHLEGRTVRLMIRAERLAGTPICEDSQSGYYLPKSTNERDLCAKRLRHRADEIRRVADAIAAADIPGGDV